MDGLFGIEQQHKPLNLYHTNMVHSYYFQTLMLGQ
jgi:hypothetical protein